MIDTKALRQKILDMAIRGKLVPQDPNDEPASVLLERIRAEKQQLIKEDKNKKDKNDSVIFKGDDNRYYENLPYGWIICGVSDIVYLRTGATFDKANVLLLNKDAGIRVLRGGNISTYKIDFRADDIFIPTEIVNPSIHVQQYDIITPAVTSLENIGKMARVSTKPISNYTVGGFVYLLTPLFHNDIFSKFLLYQLTSTWFIRQLQAIAKKSGAAFYNINKTKFNGLPVNIPPFEEQVRIVKRIEELFAEIDAIEQNQADIDTLYEEFKKRTLTLAIQGKLVPQDPNDESASVLLERIRAEKKAKLGKKYVDSYIYKGDDNCYYEKVGETVTNISDEIPFDLPENWVWIRLGYVIDFSKSDTVTASQIDPTSWVLDLEDIEKNSGGLLQKKAMRETQSKSDKHSFYKGNVLYSKLRPYLNKVLVADEDGYCTTEILAFDFGQNIAAQYAQIYLMSPYFVDYAMAGAYGVKMPRIGSTRGNAALMPIPPFNEQRRIVERYNTICKQLKDEV